MRGGDGGEQEQRGKRQGKAGGHLVYN